MRAEEQARFCLAYGIQPSEYPRLTVLERAAFHTVARQMIDERKSRGR